MKKVYCIGCGVVTPVGDTPKGVFQAVREGRSALCLHPGFPEPFFASLMPRDCTAPGTLFDHMVKEAAAAAVKEAGIDASSPRTGLILSSIKGNVEMLGHGSADVSLAVQARRLAQALGVTTAPVVVSNACISGLAALVQGMRMIQGGQFDQVIVAGCEVQSRFIVTGFQSLKALSLQACRPFDEARDGLNLGEAAAAMVLSSQPMTPMTLGEIGFSSSRTKNNFPQPWELVSGCIRNDANHISGPSRTGEGSYNALQYVLEDARPEALAFVNVHGTATRYNDEMEAIALGRAGLEKLPVNALKGIFGHTMGAAGILESIVSMQALEAGVVLPTKGYENLGVSVPVNVSAQERPAQGSQFIKLLSGFGGVNGALLFQKGGAL